MYLGCPVIEHLGLRQYMFSCCFAKLLLNHPINNVILEHSLLIEAMLLSISFLLTFILNKGGMYVTARKVLLRVFWCVWKFRTLYPLINLNPSLSEAVLKAWWTLRSVGCCVFPVTLRGRPWQEACRCSARLQSACTRQAPSMCRTSHFVIVPRVTRKVWNQVSPCLYWLLFPPHPLRLVSSVLSAITAFCIFGWTVLTCTEPSLSSQAIQPSSQASRHWMLLATRPRDALGEIPWCRFCCWSVLKFAPNVELAGLLFELEWKRPLF